MADRSTKVLAYRAGGTIHLRFRGWSGTFAPERMASQIAFYSRLARRSGSELDRNVVRALKRLDSAP